MRYQGKVLSGVDTKVILGVPVAEDCRQLCDEETDFTCLSMEYGRRLPDRPCVLQDTTMTSPEELTVNTDYDYYEFTNKQGELNSQY